MPYHIPRCQIIPLPDNQVSIQIDGQERTRWHFDPKYPRPFFYPLNGPAGSSLTRMGHPGAQNHDHHRSVWFAHNKVLGIDFWSDLTEARIRQHHWLAYEDGDEEALMGVELRWYDGHDPKELLRQEVIAAFRPGLKDGETQLELQTTFTPIADTLEFQKTNFGFLAVRVAKNISEHFGGGQLTNSEGKIHEPAIFGNRARWMDYSGPVPGGKTEGITFIDHPKNPGHPTGWHVREDGWMGASVCMFEPRITTADDHLTLRYMLFVHQDPVGTERSDELAADFAKRTELEIVKATVKHRQFLVRRRRP